MFAEKTTDGASAAKRSSGLSAKWRSAYLNAS